MTPQESIDRLGEAVAAVYPPGVLVDRTRAAPPVPTGAEPAAGPSPRVAEG